MRDRRRRRLLPLALAASATVLGACSGSEPMTGAPSTSAAPVEQTAAPTTMAVEATTPNVAAGGTTVAGDAAPMLQQALTALEAGYHFTTRVTLNGAEVLVADGDRVGDGTRLTMWSNDTSVAYVITPGGSWVFPDGGEWQALDDPPAATDPLTALRSASSVTTAASDGTTTTIDVTVPAVQLGIAGDGDAAVQVQLTGGVLTRVTYGTSVAGAPASVVSDLSAVVDATPVVAPI